MKATLLVLALLCTLALAKFSIKPEDLAKKREFAERLLATYEDDSEGHAKDESFVYVPHLENPPRRQKRASGFPGIFASCPPGYTGVQCETPVCQERANLTAHKGTDDTGDTIEFALSPACSSNVSVFVDAYQEKLFIFLHKTLPRSYPTGRLYGPDGKHIPQSEGQALGNNGNEQFYTWDNIKQYGAGIYTFSTASRSNANCAVQVSALTTVVVDGGFVESLTDDNVQQFLSEHQHTGVERDPKTGVPSYYGFKASGLEYPGSVDTVTFYVGVRKVQGPPMIVRPRYNCNAPSYVGPYICTKADMYHAKIRGLDYKGNFWQRVYEFHCDVSDLSPTPIPSIGPPSSSPTPITECFNGGILAKKNKGDGMQCFCGPFYAGDQCEQKLCLNGGTLGDQDICDCGTTNPLGYGGEFCQSVQCKAPSGENFDMSSRALAFVIRMTNKTATEDNIKSFARAANMITSYYAQKKPGYFQKHVLVFFGNKSTTFVKEYDSPEGMVLDIQNGTQYAVNDNSCFDSTLGSISDALRSPSMTRYLRSPIFVFSDALPSDDEFTEYSLYGQLSYFRGQIFNVLYHTGGDACVDPHAPGYTRLQGLSRFTHGLVTMQNASDIEEVARGISETLLGVDNLLSNDFLDSCSYAPKYQTFFVDESVGTVYVLATGPQLSAQIKGPDNKIIQPTTQEIKGDLLVASFKTPVKGNYLLSISGPSAVSISCQYRVLGESIYDLFVGMTRELTNDVQYKQPVFEEQAHIVAHFNGLQFPDPFSLYAEAQIWTNEASSAHGRRTVLYSSSGVYRDGCDYNLYFGSWKCPRRGMQFYVNVYVTDQSGYTVMRTTTGYCAADPPKITPQSGCLNGGANPYNNGTCVCTPDWNGLQCEQIRCRNQGTSHGSYCECAALWTGQYCETAMCDSTDKKHNLSPSRRSIHFLVHDSNTFAMPISGMLRVAPGVIQDITAQHPRWLVHYTLTRFTDTDFSTVTDSRNPNDIVTGLQNMLNSAKANPSRKSCNNLLVNEALFQTLKDNAQVKKGAIVYIFVKGVPLFNATVVDSALEVLERLEATVNVVQLAYPDDVCQECDPSKCNDANYPSGGSEWLHQQSLSALTGGTFLRVSDANTGGAFQTVPTQYSNNLVYENAAGDCRKGATFYFPIDSEAQAFTIYTEGDFNGVDYDGTDPVLLTDPNGRQWHSATNLTNLWSDGNQNTRFYQLTKPCDPGWEMDAHHCYLTVPERLSWEDAQTACHKEKASLATIFDPAGQRMLKLKGGNLEFWIGLNDRKTNGVFEWDQYNGVDVLLQDTTYKGWAPGEPRTGNGQCVKFTENGWVVDNCATKMLYACVKHAYDFGHAPSSAHSDLLPYGIWSAKLTVYDDGDGQLSRCSLKVYAQSSIQVFNEFTTGVHDGHGFPEPLKSAKRNRIMVHTTGVDSFSESDQGTLMYAHMYSADASELLQVETFTERDTRTCTFNYISAPFQCPVASYQIAYTGIDRYGALFQRIRPALCYGGNVDGASSCLNQGVWYDGACVCQPDWFGDRCLVPNCVHGKPAASGASCDCRYGYHNDPHCRIPNCIRNTNKGLPPPVPTGKSFVLVLDGSWTGANQDILSNLQAVLTTIIQDSTQVVPNWFNYYVAVVAYDRAHSGGVNSDIIKERDSTAFITKVVAEVTRTNYRSAGQSRAFLTALVNALSDPGISYGSWAYVVGASNAQDIDKEAAVLDATAPHATTISFFIAPDNAPPGGAFSYRAPSVAAILRTAGLSGGYFYQVTNRQNLLALWQTNLVTTYNSQTVKYAVRTECSNVQEYIQVDGHSSKLIFDFFSANRPDLTLLDSDGKKVKVQTTPTHSATNWIFVLDTGVKPGLWSLSIDAGEQNKGFCYVSIRTTLDKPVYVAFTRDVASDGGAGTNDAQEYPEQGDGNAVVVQSDHGVLTHVQFFDRTDRTLLWASPLVPRLRCTYNYVTQEIFSCPAASFTVAVDGFDENGHPFRREEHVHCVGRQRKHSLYALINMLAEV